mmetsp:Transcript_17429/g.50782  ORF Transcript_17429/g.50782 Transcript_17429/m.50782 type:complete len:283 (-) Transcript_17429:133-981(-)
MSICQIRRRFFRYGVPSNIVVLRNAVKKQAVQRQRFRMQAQKPTRADIDKHVVQAVVVDGILPPALPGLQVEIPHAAQMILEKQGGADVRRTFRPGKQLAHFLLVVFGSFAQQLEDDLTVRAVPRVAQRPRRPALHVKRPPIGDDDDGSFRLYFRSDRLSGGRATPLSWGYFQKVLPLIDLPSNRRMTVPNLDGGTAAGGQAKVRDPNPVVLEQEGGEVRRARVGGGGGGGAVRRSQSGYLPRLLVQRIKSGGCASFAPILRIDAAGGEHHPGRSFGIRRGR